MNNQNNEPEPICFTLISTGFGIGTILGYALGSFSIGFPLGITIVFLSTIIYRNSIGVSK